MRLDYFIRELLLHPPSAARMIAAAQRELLERMEDEAEVHRQRAAELSDGPERKAALAAIDAASADDALGIARGMI